MFAGLVLLLGAQSQCPLFGGAAPECESDDDCDSDETCEDGECDGSSVDNEGDDPSPAGALADAVTQLCAAAAACPNPPATQQACEDGFDGDVEALADAGPACDGAEDDYVAFLECVIADPCSGSVPEACSDEQSAVNAGVAADTACGEVLGVGAEGEGEGEGEAPATCSNFLNSGAADDCDCGCGSVDSDCNGGGCTEAGCFVETCNYCWNDNGENVQCPTP